MYSWPSGLTMKLQLSRSCILRSFVKLVRFLFGKIHWLNIKYSSALFAMKTFRWSFNKLKIKLVIYCDIGINHDEPHLKLTPLSFNPRSTMIAGITCKNMKQIVNHSLLPVTLIPFVHNILLKGTSFPHTLSIAIASGRVYNPMIPLLLQS